MFKLAAAAILFFQKLKILTVSPLYNSATGYMSYTTDRVVHHAMYNVDDRRKFTTLSVHFCLQNHGLAKRKQNVYKLAQDR